MKKSLSAPDLKGMVISSHSPRSCLNPMITSKRNSLSCNSFATFIADYNMTQQLEVITHAPAYKVGMCIVEELQTFPSNLVEVQHDLATCIMTPDDSIVPTPIYEAPNKYQRIYDNESRAGDLMLRIKRGRNRRSDSD